MGQGRCTAAGLQFCPQTSELTGLTVVCFSLCALHGSHRLFSSCRLFELSATTDYRRLSLTTAATQLLQQPLLPAATHGSNAGSSSGSSSPNRLYLWPLGPAADAAMQQLWAQHCSSPSLDSSSSNSSSSSSNPLQFSSIAPAAIAAAAGGGSAWGSSSSSGDGSSGSSALVPVMFGRTLPVSRCAGGAAWFDFDELCGRPLGSADYLALAQHYHTLFLSGEGAMTCVGGGGFTQ